MVISFKPWSYVAVPIFFLIVKLHLQGYSVQSLAYLNRCSIPYNVDEEDYQVKFEKWRVCRLESEILVFIVDLGMIQLALGRGGGGLHVKQTGMLVVSLRGVNFGFWSRLGCSGHSTDI